MLNPDAATPLAAIKQAAVEAVEAGKPVKFVFGTVASTAPLAVYVDQKTTYPAAMLILTRNVTDYSVVEERNGYRETVIVRNALQVGEEVLLARVPGGKRYIILDRMGGGGA